ncbi:MAG TPA: hypothetical protein VGK74_24685 [Symbiobacteriaceae bacterium]|jgi:hypothetical protein
MKSMLAVILIGTVVAGCSSAPLTGKNQTGITVQSAKPSVRYQFEHPDFRAFSVRRDSGGSPTYHLLLTKERVWVVRDWNSYTQDVDFGAFFLDGTTQVPFRSLKEVLPDIGDGPSFVEWLTIGERLYVQVTTVGVVLTSLTHHRLLQIYPERREFDSSSVAGLTGMVAGDGRVYATSQNHNELYVLDENFKVTDHFPVKGGIFSRILPIGSDQLLIGNAPFDLQTKDFYWDAAGATRKTLPGWGAIGTTDPSGVLWFATSGTGTKLQLLAETRDGQVLANQVVAPHELAHDVFAIEATRDALVVTTIGMYQGQEHLLLYTFKRK